MARKLIRFALSFFLLSTFYLVTYPLWLLVKNKQRRLLLTTRLSSYWCRALLRALDIKVDTRLHPDVDKSKTYFVAANHLSYLDIFIISGVLPSVFVASVDGVKESPVLGKITELSGGVFVERRRKWGILKEIDTISGIMNMGHNVVLFPEGTTSDGEALLPFKTSFFRTPQLSRVDVLPVCIKYTKANGEPLSDQNRFSVFFYGKITFFKHLFKMLDLRSIDAELKFLGPIKTENYLCRKEIAKEAFTVINKEYQTRTYKIYDYKTKGFCEKTYSGSGFTKDGFSY